MKVVKKIRRPKTLIQQLKDSNGDTYYSKTFKISFLIKLFISKKEKIQAKSLLLNDFASIQFMSQFPELSEYVPRFHSGSKEELSFIMTDVGDGQQLNEILLGDDAALAEEVLLGFMKTLATIHKETIGKESQFSKIRDGLGAPYVKGEVKGNELEFLNALEGIRTTFNIDFVSQNIEKEIREIFQVIYEPQKLYGLTHWDPCPDNCKFVDGKVKIFDYDSGCYSNVLIDGLFLSTRFPSCWCCADIPQTIIDKAEKEYRSILSQKVPEINSDSYFLEQKAVILIYWLLHALTNDLKHTLKKDAQWGLTSMRQRILLKLELTNKILKEQNIFSEISQLFEKLNSELSGRWGEGIAEVKMYNAFLETNKT